MQSHLIKEIDDLRTELKRCADQTRSNMAQIDNNSKRIKLLEKCNNELSRFYAKEEEKIPYVFTAPPINNYFTGRTIEIQKLKRILEIEETSNEKKVRVVAVCGLGGIGKTSLVSEYAHQMKDFYKGGVYWFSAENDARFRTTVNAVAVRIGALLDSFNLSLSNIMKKISTVKDPCLIILDCLDQHDISFNVMEFLSFPSKENILGHFLVTTRKNKEILVNDVPVFTERSCFTLDRLPPEEAKEFLFARSEVLRDENENSDSVAACLCKELGKLPLALEQAGAYVKIVPSCSLALYLKQYKVQSLRLLDRQRARPASNDDSPDHRAVHTTWLMDMEYMKNSPDGHAAVRFMNACSFFDENEIQKELLNVGLPEVEDVAYRECLLSPLGSGQVFKLLTDFSLFTYVEESSVSTNRMVQEVVWDNLDPKSKADTLIDAVRMLFYAFSKCPSPRNHASLDATECEEHDISFSDPPDSRSHFFMWSKFCMHSHQLRKKVVKEGLDSDWLDSVWFLETAKILYECAVHLSANHQQEEAKRTLNFAFRVLDWMPLAGYETFAKDVSDGYFLFSIPLPMLFQTKIPEYCIPPTFTSLKSLPEKVAPDATDLAPDATDVAADITDLAPDATDLAADATDLALDATDLALDATNLTPDATDLASDATELAPDPTDYAPDATDLAPDATDLAPDATDLAPDATDLAPDATDIAADDTDVAFDATGSASDATDVTPSDATCFDLDTKMEKFKLDGNMFFEKGSYQKAVVAYSSAIKLAQDSNQPFDPLLLTQRSKVYINLKQWQNALKDANDYITRHPDCWRGYALKAVALDGLNKEVSTEFKDNASAEIAAALAFYYYNKNNFADLPSIFMETFPNLQSRIFICNSVDELLGAMLSQEVETDLMKILVLGSEEVYILNSEIVDKPWNNCILVGTRKNCSVTLKPDYDISLSKCMLTNLSFNLDQYQLHCLPDSFVKILNCNFTSRDDYDETIITEGVFNAEQCNFKKSPLVCGKQSRAVIRDCSFCDNSKGGIRVQEGTTFKMEDSRVYNNGGFGVFVERTDCSVVNCDIHDNGRNGITTYQSKNVQLKRNNAFNNRGAGIRVGSPALVCVRENNLYDNDGWGIYNTSMNGFEISTNKISHNKCGGILMYLKPDAEKNTSSVIEWNYIFYNNGPGLMVNNQIINSHTANSFQSIKIENNENYHNKDDDSKLNFSVPYCSYCRVNFEHVRNPTTCEKCFATAYCSESCQEEHYLKHEKICKVLREKSSYLIISTQDESYKALEGMEYSKEVGPEFSDPPPRDGRKFVVKMYNYANQTGIYRLYLHDRSLNLCVKFISKVVDQLVKEFGVICEGRRDMKKLFFRCLFEDNGHLRLLTNEFAEFQDW